MKKQFAILAAGVWLAASTIALAVDTVKTADSNVLGKVTKMSALEVTVETGAVQKPVPVNQIEVIYYENEPTMLKSVRAAIAAGRYEDALSTIEKIPADSVSRNEVKQDIEFYTALCGAKMALGGNGDIKAAGGVMSDFVRGNSGNYHYFEGCLVVGDLLVAIGSFDTAETYYGQLAKAPWPDYQMRAGVAVGRAKLAGGKAPEALKSFQAVLDTPGQGAAADSQRLAATLGKARCLAEAGNPAEAIKLVQGVIDNASAEELQLHAQAYNALGAAHRKAGRTKDALLAFLHVDVLYFAASAEHVEALRNLAELWNEVQKPERAIAAAQTLKERYKVSTGSP